MRRIVVVGGRGFFGATAVDRLRKDGAAPLVASRRPGADLQLDPESANSIDAALRPGDVVIDAAGPFQARTLRLLDVALRLKVDVIDISDSMSFTVGVLERRDAIGAAGIRVLTACSSMSAVVATLVRMTDVPEPIRVSVFLSPATRFTATAGTAGSLQRSLGRRITILRGGSLVTTVGWRRSRRVRMPPPLGWRRGYLVETVDAITLPMIWPSLRDVDLWVHAGLFGPLLALAAQVPAVLPAVARLQQRALPLVRRVGPAAGGLAVIVEDARGEPRGYALVASAGSYVAAVAPAVLAARAIAEDRFAERGLIPPDRHVPAGVLLVYLESAGLRCLPLQL